MNKSSPALRLVGGHGTKINALNPSGIMHSALLELQSARVAKNAIDGDAVVDLLLSLRPQELLVFQHEINAASEADLKAPYSFSIAAKSLRDDHAAFATRVANALASACPALHFAPSATANESATKHVHKYSHAWKISAAPAIIALRPNRASYAKDQVHQPVHAPFPCDLPSTSLSCISSEALLAGQPLCISISFGAFSLSEDECIAWHSHLHKMAAGMLVTFHPHSPYQGLFSIDMQLLEKTKTLVDAWLKQPSRGCAFDCVVEADGLLSAAQLKQIARNIFGDHPVAINAMAYHDTKVLPQFSFADAIKPGQGLPAMFFDSTQNSTLSALGIATHFSKPIMQPPSVGGAVIGTTMCGTNSSVVALPARDRFMHTGVFGASGSGKSTFLLRLLEQDLANPSKPGIALIDPHGSLCNDVLQLIPKSRIKDVVFVDVTDSEFVCAINPLEGMAQDTQYANFIASEIVQLIGVLFESKESGGPVARSHIKNALLLSSYIPSRASTFIDAARLFEDSDFRNYLLAKCNDRKIVSYWRDFVNSCGEHGFKNWLPYLQPRFAPFCESPSMRRMLNSPKSSVDIDACMRDGKIILFNLSSATLGSVETRIFGNLMINKIFYAAMQRTPKPSVVYRPFHLIVDEAASMVSESTMRLWAEARKYGLSLTTANQSLGQLRNGSGETTIANALLANTATKIMFRLGPADASILESYASPELTAQQLTRLPVFHAAVSMANEGQVLPAFVCKVTRPIPNAAIHAPIQQVMRASRQGYGRKVSDVVGELAATHDLPEVSLRVSAVERAA